LNSERYTPEELAAMARRLDECLALSTLCMNLALAGERHRAAGATASSAGAGPEAPGANAKGSSGQRQTFLF
jgi:hypothetical protein